MITLLKNGKLYDPAHSKDGVVEDIYIRDGRIVVKPNASENIAQTYDLTGKVIMAGAIEGTNTAWIHHLYADGLCSVQRPCDVVVDYFLISFLT